MVCHPSLLSGYWQLGMTDRAKERSAFCTRRGLFQFCLSATCTQAPVGSLQAAIPSSGRGGGAPMYLSALHHPLGGATLRIPTIVLIIIRNRI